MKWNWEAYKKWDKKNIMNIIFVKFIVPLFLEFYSKTKQKPNNQKKPTDRPFRFYPQISRILALL